MKEVLDLQEFRAFMKDLAEKDSQIKSVQINAETLEEGLKEAAIELGVSEKKLEYEIIVKGSKGFLGFGKKNFTLVVYKIDDGQDKSSIFDETDSDEFVEADIEINTDGEAVVSLYKGDVLLKVVPPVGKGRKITPDEVYKMIQGRGIHEFDKNTVSKVTKLADNIPIKVGTFIHNPGNDSIMSLSIEESDMKAYITISPPGPGGSDIIKDTVFAFLKNNSVIYGVDEEKLEKVIDHKLYNEPILVAEGTFPVNGKDAEITYNFNIEAIPSFLKEKEGKIDFKDKNLVQNVVAGQILAEKAPAEKGVKGRTVTGKPLEARNGADKEFKIGNNTELSKDGLKVTSLCNGQVMMVGDKITVENVYIVDGDVNLTTGNIHFLGTVMVKGNVEDGFSIKATGNIEVMGNVGKCNLDAVGNVIVHQGINCKEDGLVRAGKGVVAKFIQNSKVEADEIVFVSDGIINSYVDSNKKVICRGKRATIVGGRIRATEEISAKNFGSLAVGLTEVEVGYDPRSKARLIELEQKKGEIEKEMDDIDRNLVTLENLKKKMRGKFPEEKQKVLDTLNSRILELKGDLESCDRENEEIHKYLQSLRTVGKISASGTVNPGVKITIRDAHLEVKNELKRITFINDESVIKTKKYEEPEDESLEEE